jgi:NAD(P)H-nitrite reductase large subunit
MQKIDTYLTTYQPKKAVVIGAGLNGIEAASTLAHRGLHVQIIELNATILPGQIDSNVAAWITSRAQAHQVFCHTQTKAQKIATENNQLTGVMLEDGKILEAQMVIITAGSALSSQLLENTGIAMDQGSIIVNAHQQTNISNILAAGDICKVADIISKKMVRSTTWSDAMLQGLCAATTLSLTPRAYPGAIGLRDSYFFGKDFYACGNTTNPDHKPHIKDWDDEKIEIWYTDQQQRLQGFVLIGDVSKVAELKKLYLTQNPIS